jgi:menaquinone-9 beta-reductase
MTAYSATYDAVVIGARCAGASTGMLLARQGLRVLIADSGVYGSDTLSTHALMRGAVLQLHNWGILDRLVAAGTPAVRTTSFYYGDEVIDIQIKPGDGIDALYAPRRTLLDSLLVDAARSGGAEVMHQTRLVDLIRSSDGRVEGVVLQNSSGEKRRIRGGIVIGADGLKSTVARLTGADAYHTGRHAASTVFGYWAGLDIAGYHWHFRPGVAAGAIPTNGGLTILFVAVPARRFREELATDVSAGFHRLLQACAPGLALAAERGEREGNFRGFPGQPGFVRQCCGPGWALVGDSGYFRDPLIAHGITDALRDAELLSRGVVEGTERSLAGYQANRDELSLNLFRLSDEIASFNWGFDELKEKHISMSKEMGREVDLLIRLHAAGAPAVFNSPY